MTTERTPAEHRACDSPTLICPHALTRCGGFVQERHVKHCRVCQNPWPCDASLYATQLAEAQAQVATRDGQITALLEIVNEATAEIVRIDPHVQMTGFDPAQDLIDIVPIATRYTEQAEQRGAEKVLSVERIAAALGHAEGNYLIFDSPTAVADLAAALRDALLSDSATLRATEEGAETER